MSKATIQQACFAEFLATAIFIYIGCGSVLAYNVTAGSIVGIALAFGLGISTLAFSIGHVSGGHINPMVTIAMVIVGEITYANAALYIISQLVGSIVGAAMLLISTSKSELAMATNGISDQTNTGGAFVMEAVLSFLLVFVILQTSVHPSSGAGNNAPLAIGFAVFLAHIVAIPFTGTSINPARSFGPAVVSGNMDELWLFIVAPIVGGSIAALVGKYILLPCDSNDDEEEKEPKKEFQKVETNENVEEDVPVEEV
jgi:MIP family channel proteins